MRNKKNIRSVDFKLKMVGEGCVNFNGQLRYYSAGAGKQVDNVKTPKMLNWSNRQTEGENKGQFIDPETITSNNEAKMYISTNCLRHWIFRDEFPNHIPGMEAKDALDLLVDPGGLMRGFAITDSTPLMRKSPFFIGKAVDSKREFVCELKTTSGEKGETSLRNEINTGETEYSSHGSISVEDLQFIPCDNVFGRASAMATEEEFKQLAENITKMLKDLSEDLELPSCSPLAEYDFWKRKGRIVKDGEWGILLNQDGIHLLVLWILERLSELVIRQGNGGYAKVCSQEVDYNTGDSNTGGFLRIKDGNANCVSKKNENMMYEIYYEKMDPKLSRPKVTAEEKAEQKREKGTRSKSPKKIAKATNTDKVVSETVSVPSSETTAEATKTEENAG